MTSEIAPTLKERTLALLGTWSRPPDFPAKVAVAIAVIFAIAAVTRPLWLFGLGDGTSDDEIRDPERARTSRRLFLAVTAFIAALLSLGYVAAYLRGGPRIIDATTYFLQGRALSQGDLSWTPLEPTANFRGRFLLYGEGDGGSLAGIFPPGYPLLLAFGFFLGAPMIVGPILAGLIVIATYHLAREVAESSDAKAIAEPIARSAALLSVVCGALRYHTADTMSHGATALGITAALVFAIRARRDPRRRVALFAGLAVGFVFATRPVSAIPLALVVAWTMSKPDHGERRRAVSFALAGLVPGLFLLVLSQRAAAGSWFASTQRMYYALSDGPPGCFRWGFGRGTGCLYEHGEFVKARLPDGYGVLAAAGTTLRRLHRHLLDIANFEPLALLVLVPLRKPRSRLVVALAALVGLQILAYAPFYFDGDYPGGGARFLADVLPIEHVLVVLAVARLAKSAPSFVRAALATLAVSAAAFAVHAAHEHGKLRDRDGGRPMFEPDVLAKANLVYGLVFVDTDHGFALGHNPSARVMRNVLVARLRNDDRDRLLFDALGRPPSFKYQFEIPATGEATPALVPWSPPDLGNPLRFEAEAEWPAVSQEGGFAAPAFTDACASGSRALVLTPAGDVAHAKIELPVPKAGKYSVILRIVHGARLPFAPSQPLGAGEVRLTTHRWRWTERNDPRVTCEDFPAQIVELAPPHAVVEIDARGGAVSIDRITLRELH